jgi:hypothetical protein
VPASEDDWKPPLSNVAIDPAPIFREADDASIDPEPIVRETGDASINPEPIFREAEQAVATVEFKVAGEVSATFNGSTVSLIPENDAESPQGIDPKPIFSETATDDSSPDLIGENG